MLKYHRDRIIKGAEESKTYQSVVQHRLKSQRSKEQEHEDLSIKFIASMLPTAMEMHKFTNIMQKDRALEEPRAYKVVTSIRTFKDKERL